MALACAAVAATLARRGMVFLVAAARAGLLAAAALLVDRRPGAALGLLLRDAAVLIALLDMLGLALLLVGVAAHVAARHGTLLLLHAVEHRDVGLHDRHDLGRDVAQRRHVAAIGIALVQHQRVLVRLLLLPDIEPVAVAAMRGAQRGEIAAHLAVAQRRPRMEAGARGGSLDHRGALGVIV